MKLGIVSRISEFPEEFWKEEFETFAGKIDYIEIISNCPHFPAHKVKIDDAETLTLKNLGEKYKIPIKAIHHLPNQCLGATPATGLENFLEQEKKLQREYFNLSSFNEKVRKESVEQIKRIFPVAKFLGAGIVSAHGGSYEGKQYSSEHLEVLKRSLKEINKHIETNFKEKIKFCIENMPSIGHFGKEVKELPKKPEEMVYCVSGLEYIGICFDIGHANTVQNPIYFFDVISETGKVYGIHFHNNNGERDDHLPLDKGNIDFKRFFEKLKQDSYKGYSSIELDTWPEPPQPMEKQERLAALDYLVNLGVKNKEKNI